MMQFVWVLHKDLFVEWRARSRIVGLATYALVMLLIFAFAVGTDTTALQQHAGAYLWLAVLSASTLLLVQSFQQETEAGALDGLLLLPVNPVALFYGKAVANLVLLTLLAAVALGSSFFLYDLHLRGSLVLLCLNVVLGTAGLAAPGTLYAALTARAPAQQLLLPLLLLPLVVPPVLAVVKVTDLLLVGDPMNQLSSWLAVLASFDLVYWSLTGVLFARLVEE